jgi:hypothetical protein
MLANDVEPALSRALRALLGHQARGVGTHAKGDGDHLVRGGHLEIERRHDLALEPLDVVVADMPPVLAQMRRDPVGPGHGGEMRRPDGIRVLPAAGVAEGRHVVDVHAET